MLRNIEVVDCCLKQQTLIILIRTLPDGYNMGLDQEASNYL